MMRIRHICCSHGPVGRLPLVLRLLLRPATDRWLQKFGAREDGR
jgi:hypothetical protein